MFTSAEGIVGLWFVPVILCILVPLAMLCVWSGKQVFKKTGSKIEQIEKSVKDKRGKIVKDTEIVTICTLF